MYAQVFVTLSQHQHAQLHKVHASERKGGRGGKLMEIEAVRGRGRGREGEGGGRRRGGKREREGG